MKRVFFILVVTTLFLHPLFILTVKAEDASSSANRNVREEIKAQRKEAATIRETEIKAMREEMAKKRQELMTSFKARLDQIKDTRKKDIVKNVDERIANKNSDWASHWNNVIQRLTTLLDKIESRADEAAASGKNISSVTAAISAANTALSAAQVKIDAQAGKTYSITVTDESTLKSNVRSVIESFHTDVKNVVAALNEARRAIDAAHKALKSVVSEPAPTATVSPTATPTPTATAAPSV